MASSCYPLPLCPVSVTDCPQCGGLCLGAVILPCGHLSCRRCCHHLLQQQGGPHITCHLCARDLPLPRECSSVSQVVQRLGTDPVTDHLVQQRLLSQGRVGCQVHGNSDATMVCEDCHDYFCGSCCDVHRKQTATSDHVLRLLPTALHNMSSLSNILPTPKTYTTSLTDSSVSISNPDDPQPHSQSRSKTVSRQWLQKEAQLLQQSASDRRAAASTVKEIIALGEQILSKIEAQEQLLRTCSDCLSGCDVTYEKDSQTFVIRRSMDDVTMTVKTEGLERRLRHVRESHQSPSVTALDRLRTQIIDLMHGESYYAQRACEITQCIRDHTCNRAHEHKHTHTDVVHGR